MGGMSALGMIKSLKENKKLLKAVGYFKTMEDHDFRRSGKKLRFKKASTEEWQVIRARIEAKRVRSKWINGFALLIGLSTLIAFLMYIN